MRVVKSVLIMAPIPLVSCFGAVAIGSATSISPSVGVTVLYELADSEGDVETSIPAPRPNAVVVRRSLVAYLGWQRGL